jgi:hypothetical protein
MQASPSHSCRVPVIPVASLSSLSHPCHLRRIPIIPVMSPLCPQLLVGLGVGAVSYGPSSVHTPSTPRAVACEAGGTWGVIHGGCGGGLPSQRCGVWVKGG